MNINKNLLSFVRSEFVRLREKNGDAQYETQSIEAEIRDEHLPIHQAIALRANRLLGEHDRQRLEKPLKQYRRLQYLFLGLFFIVGALATNQVFSGAQQTSANFFWILLGLLGVNAISLIVWVVLILMKNPMDGTGTWLLTVQRWLNRFKPDSLIDLQAWQSGLFHPKARRWQISVISHALWLSFLIGGLLMALLLLSTRQYDFVWESTILSPEIFIAITQKLSALPRAFGVQAPNAEQVISSRIGVEQIENGALRTLWSNLLLSSLLLYGIVPRAVALMVSVIMRTNAWRNLAPDFDIPYYHQLRLLLMPTTINGRIIDPDTEVVDTNIKTSFTDAASIKPLIAATNIGLIGVEWGETWPPQSDIKEIGGLNIEHTSVDASDRATRQQAIAFIDDVQPKHILLLGRFVSTPDRGIVQFIKQITDHHYSVWLVLVNHTINDPDNQRWLDWRYAAEKANIDSSKVCLINNTRPSKNK